ncbi:hypothetical protein AB0F07_01760 [Streptomyces fructofermentans]|uniref:hypothetical protein n=1 Tax=Streptomyces fructofermentans TaxID=152141 RepID=UPI0033EDEC2C
MSDEVIGEKEPGTRRIAVLGEMLELGDTAAHAHWDIGQETGRLGVDIVIAVGDVLAKQLALGAADAGVDTPSWARITTPPSHYETVIQVR